MTNLHSRRQALAIFGASLIAARAGPATAGAAGPVQVPIRTATGRISMVTHWPSRRRKGVVLFSHGAASAPSHYDGIILPWVAAGYEVWAPLHVDSPQHPDTKAFAGLATWRARIEDMRALAAYVGGRYVAAGHSFGGLTALTLGGASAIAPDGIAGPLRDPNATAVVAFSPPGPIPTLISAAGYATLAVPALIQTGDRDVSLAPGADPESWRLHLAAFEAAPAGGDRYALVLAGVNHFFGGLICWPDQPGPPQEAQLARAADYSRLFIDAYGTGSAKARRALDARLRDAGPAILRRR